MVTKSATTPPDQQHGNPPTAPPGAVARTVLSQRRRSVLLWSLAVAVLAALYIAFWPSISADSAVMTDYVDAMPDQLVQAMGLTAIATPAGYLASTVYGIIAPALLLVMAIGSGARLLAGAEEDATIELELTSPASRRQVYLERLISLWAIVAVVVAALTAAVLLAATLAEMDIQVSRVLAGSTGLLLLVLALGTVSLAAGAATGRRTMALALGAGLAVASYVANALGATLKHAAWLNDASPWSWYLGSDPLSTGFDSAGLLLLAALTLVAAVSGLIAFQRRDLMV